MIEPSDLGGDADAARRVLVRARAIAPCLNSLEGEARDEAIAILKGVLAEAPEAGTRRAKQLSRNGTAVTFTEGAASFTVEDVTSLRSLCTAQEAQGLAQASFPVDVLFERLWPEERYR